MKRPRTSSRATEILRSITGRDHLSHTQVTTYQGCPLRWWFAYVVDQPREHLASSLVFGAAIHAAVEHHFQMMMQGAESPTLDDLLAAFDDSWSEQCTAPVQFGRGDTVSSLRELASSMLAVFRDSRAAVVDGRILGIEEEVRGQVAGRVPDLLARLDLIYLTDDGLVIRDFKTARSAWNPEKLAEASSQLILYAELTKSIARACGDVPVRMEFCVITKAKSPTVEILAVESDMDRLARTKAVIRQVWQSMRAGHVYPNPSPMNCASCPFQRACRHWCG